MPEMYLTPAAWRPTQATSSAMLTDAGDSMVGIRLDTAEETKEAAGGKEGVRSAPPRISSCSELGARRVG